jgi:hypothetical protein
MYRAASRETGLGLRVSEVGDETELFAGSAERLCDGTQHKWNEPAASRMAKVRGAVE